MEFCGTKREIDRKCLNHARVHANAQSFDRCESHVSHVPVPLQGTGRREDPGNEVATAIFLGSVVQLLLLINFLQSSYSCYFFLFLLPGAATHCSVTFHSALPCFLSFLHFPPSFPSAPHHNPVSVVSLSQLALFYVEATSSDMEYSACIHVSPMEHSSIRVK